MILNNGANIVIIGRPNVGKSSLLNALANEEVAISYLNCRNDTRYSAPKIIIDGVPFNIIDTAGIRETQDVVEQIGIERAISVVKEADLALVLIDDSIGMSDEDCQILDKLPAELPRILFIIKLIYQLGSLLSQKMKAELKFISLLNLI